MSLTKLRALASVTRVLLALTLFVSFSVRTASAQWTKVCDTLAVQTDNGGGAMVEANGLLFFGHGWDGVFRSTDGGATWEAVNTGITLTERVSCLAAVPASDGSGTQYLYAGTQAATIYRSTDDGANWVKVYTGPNNGYSAQIACLASSGSTLMAGLFFDPYAVVTTVNDGGSWTPSNAGIPDDSVEVTPKTHTINSLASIVAGSTTYFYAGTSTGVCVSSSGGAGWTNISSGLPAKPVYAITAVHPAGSSLSIVLFAGVWGAGMYKSTDNGATWVPANVGMPNTGTSSGPVTYVDALASVPGPSGTTPSVFALAFPSVYVSTDLGGLWQETGLREASGANAYGALCVTGGYVFVQQYDESLWRYSTNVDSSWVVQASNTTDSLCCVKAVDNHVAWAAGVNGRVLRTMDTGTTWTSVGGGAIGADTVFAIEALDANTAFVAGSSGRILRTTNGGGSWSSVATASGVTFGGIQMKTATEGYAVGTGSAATWTILKTTNGGATWAAVPAPPAVDSLAALVRLYYGAESTRPSGVQYHDGVLGFASVGGVQYTSADGATTWKTAPIGGTAFFPSAMHFNTSTLGIVGSGFLDAYGGATRVTTNGGAAWNGGATIAAKIVTGIGGLASEFWATIGGAIAYTRDNGATWSYSTPGHWGLSQLDAIAFSLAASQLNGWAVGRSGLILHYTRNGVTSAGEPAAAPLRFALEQNVPNPFRQATGIRYDVARAGHVEVAVYDLMGRRLATLVDEVKPPGRYSVTWDATGRASGVYFCRMTAGAFTRTLKIVSAR